MKKRLTPHEKKQLEYTKDHLDVAEYPHSFRKSWPRKQASARRAFRRKIRQLNTSLTVRDEDNFPDGIEPETIRRRFVQKWPVVPMGEVISRRIENRLLRTAWNFFKRPYDSALDNERFVAFLASQVVGRTEQSQKLARLFRQTLSSERPYANDMAFGGNASSNYDLHEWPPSWGKWHNWIYEFFKDEPAWEKRLRDWADSFES